MYSSMRNSVSEIQISMCTVRCLPAASPSPLSPHTSTLFSSNSSWDFGRHRACQFLIVASQTEQIHLRAWLSNTNFWFAAYLLQIVNAPQFLFLSLYRICTHTHTRFQVFLLSLSHTHTHTHTHCYLWWLMVNGWYQLWCFGKQCDPNYTVCGARYKWKITSFGIFSCEAFIKMTSSRVH